MEVGLRKHKATHFQKELPKGRDLNDHFACFQCLPKMLKPLLESVSILLVFGYVQL